MLWGSHRVNCHARSFRGYIRGARNQKSVLLSAVCLTGKCKDEDIALKCYVKGTWQCTGSVCLSLGHPSALVSKWIKNYDLVWLKREICLVIKSWIFFQLDFSSLCPYAQRDTGPGLSPLSRLASPSLSHRRLQCCCSSGTGSEAGRLFKVVVPHLPAHWILRVGL